MKSIKIILVLTLLILGISGFGMSNTASAASSVNSKNCNKDINHSWCYRVDNPHFNGDVYHVHIYKKSVHYYCIRLDNLSECDKKKNKVHKYESLPTYVQDKVMNDSKVKEHVKKYNKNAQGWANKIPKWALVSAAAVLVALSAITVFFPGDDVFAWGVLLRALA